MRSFHLQALIHIDRLVALVAVPHCKFVCGLKYDAWLRVHIHLLRCCRDSLAGVKVGSGERGLGDGAPAAGGACIVVPDGEGPIDTGRKRVTGQNFLILVVTVSVVVINSSSKIDAMELSFSNHAT
jgi:hypothetical protein